MLDVRVSEDRKIYAVINCGAKYVPPVVEMSSWYDRGRIYTVNDSGMNTTWYYPESVVSENFPGCPPSGLLDILMRSRPDLGLRETPPEKFVEFYDHERRLVRDYLIKKPLVRPSREL